MHTSKLADFNDISCFLLMLQALIHFYILEFDMYAYIFNEIFFFLISNQFSSSLLCLLGFQILNCTGDNDGRIKLDKNWSFEATIRFAN